MELPFIDSFMEEDLGLPETEGSDALSFGSSGDEAIRTRPANPHARDAGTHPATRE